MPRIYVRKTERGAWTVDQLENATKRVSKGEMSIRSAANHFGVPYSTLRDRMNNGKVNSPRFGMKPVFTDDKENKMTDHLLKMAQMFYGLTKLQLRRAAFVYAEKNGIPHRFNKTKELAGKDWLYGFLNRNKSVSIRKPEATSINRIMAFNKAEVKVFYDNLEEVMSKYKFTPDRIYNFDETGKAIVHKSSSILAKKGLKRVGAATSAERGKNHTIACAVSAAGHYVPPMFIFPRVRMAANLTIGGPPGSIYKASKSGWMTEELFVEWLIHFKEKTNPSTSNPILLILDNHSTHCSVEAYDFCIANGIVVLSIPPHTSHRLQPLDLTIFGPLNTAFDDAIEAEMKKKNYLKITSEQLPTLFNEAWTKICATEKAVNGFKSAGIYPFNRNVFSDDEYYIDNENNNETHEVEIVAEQREVKENGGDIGQSIDETNKGDIDHENEFFDLADDNQYVVEVITESDFNQSQTANIQPSLKSMVVSEEALLNDGFLIVEPLLSNVDENLLGNSAVQIEFSAIVPAPTIAKQKSTRKRREKQHSEIITSSAYKIVLDKKRERREMKELKKSSNKAENVGKKRGRPKNSLNNKVTEEGVGKKRGRPKNSLNNKVTEEGEKPKKNLNTEVEKSEKGEKCKNNLDKKAEKGKKTKKNLENKVAQKRGKPKKSQAVETIAKPYNEPGQSKDVLKPKTPPIQREVPNSSIKEQPCELLDFEKFYVENITCNINLTNSIKDDNDE